MLPRWLYLVLMLALRAPAQPLSVAPSSTAAPLPVETLRAAAADDGAAPVAPIPDDDGDDDDDDDDAVVLPPAVAALLPRAADATPPAAVLTLCDRVACSRLFRPPRSV